MLHPQWISTHFRSTDDGAGGWFATRLRAAKFWGRCLWHGIHVDSCLQTLRHLGLYDELSHRPEIVLRPLRSYLRSDLSPVARAQAVKSHFEWMCLHLRDDVTRSLALDDRRHLLLDGSPVEGLQLALRGVSNQSREGELCLEMLWRGERLMFVLFNLVDLSVLQPAGLRDLGTGLFVGGVQGVRGTDAAFKEVTAAAQRLRPVSLLTTAVQGLAHAWGLPVVLGVAADAHVYAPYRKRRKVTLDYDEVWEDAGAQRLDVAHWRLPTHPVLRPESEVESKRRSQLRRRNALKSELFHAIAAPAQSLMSAEPAFQVHWDTPAEPPEGCQAA